MQAHKNNGIPFYKASDVEAAARGNWAKIFTQFAPNSLDEALDKLGRHVTCPVHGTSNKNGKGDGFRFVKKNFDDGHGICNSCGNIGNGFQVLMWVNNQPFKEVLTDVAEYLGVKPSKYLTDRQASGSTPKQAHSQNRQPHQANNVVPMVQKSKPIQPTPEQVAKAAKIDKNVTSSNQVTNEKDLKRISTTWANSRPLANGLPGPLLKFWKRRNVLLATPDRLLNGDNLRFVKELPYYEEDDNGDFKMLGNYPALISRVKNLSGETITLHRTYLSLAGDKAPVESARKMMSVPEGKTCTGSAIQLGGMPVNGVLGVAEGQETALSVMKAYSSFPTWSAINAGLLENIEIPQNVHTVLIWGDRDISLAGQNAAFALKSRVEELGKTAYVLIPNRAIPEGKKSIDWNDIMIDEGRWGFPDWRLIKGMIDKGAHNERL